MDLIIDGKISDGSSLMGEFMGETGVMWSADPRALILSRFISNRTSPLD